MGIILGYTEVSIKVIIPIIVGIITVPVINAATKDNKIEANSVVGTSVKATTTAASIPVLVRTAQALKAAKKYKVSSTSSNKLLDIRRGAVLQALDRLKRQIRDIRDDIKRAETKYNKSYSAVKTESSVSQYDKIVNTILEEFNDGNINTNTCIALMEKASERYL